MTDTPRAHTVDEVRDMMLRQFAAVAHDWATNSTVEMTTLDRCNGVVWTILAILDGTSLPLPNVSLVLDPHDGDKPWNIENGDNYFEAGMLINGDTLRHAWSKHEIKIA